MANKKKSSVKQPSKATLKATRKLPEALIEKKNFPCVYCPKQDTVHIKMDKKANIARLKCSACGENSDMVLEKFRDPIDVYYEWSDRAKADLGNEYTGSTTHKKQGFLPLGTPIPKPVLKGEEHVSDDDGPLDLPKLRSFSKTSSTTPLFEHDTDSVASLPTRVSKPLSKGGSMFDHMNAMRGNRPVKSKISTMTVAAKPTGVTKKTNKKLFGTAAYKRKFEAVAEQMSARETTPEAEERLQLLREDEERLKTQKEAEAEEKAERDLELFGELDDDAVVLADEEPFGGSKFVADDEGFGTRDVAADDTAETQRAPPERSNALQQMDEECQNSMVPDDDEEWGPLFVSDSDSDKEN